MEEKILGFNKEINTSQHAMLSFSKLGKHPGTFTSIYELSTGSPQTITIRYEITSNKYMYTKNK